MRAWCSGGLKEGVENLIQMQVVLRDYISKAKIKKNL